MLNHVRESDTTTQVIRKSLNSFNITMLKFPTRSLKILRTALLTTNAWQINKLSSSCLSSRSSFTVTLLNRMELLRGLFRTNVLIPLQFLAAAMAFLLLQTGPLASEARADITTDLIGLWRFEEGSGTTTSDSSGSGNTGTLVNGPTWTTGQLDGALSFDGVDDYIDIGALNIQGSAMTLSAWFITDTLSGCGMRIAAKATDGSEQGHTWMLSLCDSSGSKLRARLKTNGNTDTLIASSGTISSNTWTHAVFTYDGSTMRLYKDAQDVGSMAKSGTIDTNSVGAAIGRNGEDAQHWKGKIDEVHIYNRALSVQEVSDLYQSGLTPDTTPASTPTNLLANAVSQSQIDISWTASNDPETGVLKYNIYRDGINVGLSTTLNFSDSRPHPLTAETS